MQNFACANMYLAALVNCAIFTQVTCTFSMSVLYVELDRNESAFALIGRFIGADQSVRLARSRFDLIQRKTNSYKGYRTDQPLNLYGR